MTTRPSTPVPTSATCRCPPRPRPNRVVVVATKNPGSGSGIHDPLGWGQRGGAVKPHEAGLEEQRHRQAAALASQQERSSGKVCSHTYMLDVGCHRFQPPLAHPDAHPRNAPPPLPQGSHQPQGSSASKHGKDSPAQREIMAVEHDKAELKAEAEADDE